LATPPRAKNSSSAYQAANQISYDKSVLLGILTSMTNSLLAANSDVKADITAFTKRLGEEANHS